MSTAPLLPQEIVGPTGTNTRLIAPVSGQLAIAVMNGVRMDGAGIRTATTAAVLNDYAAGESRRKGLPTNPRTSPNGWLANMAKRYNGDGRSQKGTSLRDEIRQQVEMIRKDTGVEDVARQIGYSPLGTAAIQVAFTGAFIDGDGEEHRLYEEDSERLRWLRASFGCLIGHRLHSDGCDVCADLFTAVEGEEDPMEGPDWVGALGRLNVSQEAIFAWSVQMNEAGYPTGADQDRPEVRKAPVVQELPVVSMPVADLGDDMDHATRTADGRRVAVGFDPSESF